MTIPQYAVSVTPDCLVPAVCFIEKVVCSIRYKRCAVPLQLIRYILLKASRRHSCSPAGGK